MFEKRETIGDKTTKHTRILQL